MLFNKRPSFVLSLDFLFFGSKILNHMLITATLKLSPPSHTPTLCQNPAVFYTVWLSAGCVSLTTFFCLFFDLKFLIVIVFSCGVKRCLPSMHILKSVSF